VVHHPVGRTMSAPSIAPRLRRRVGAVRPVAIRIVMSSAGCGHLREQHRSISCRAGRA
jgi:hypothetical protein